MNEEQRKRLEDCESALKYHNELLSISNQGGGHTREWSMSYERNLEYLSGFIPDLLSLLAQSEERVREEMQKVYDHIEQELSIRLFDHPVYSLTQIMHGIRSEFNDYLGVDEKLEEAFQKGEDYDFPIQCSVITNTPNYIRQ